MQILPTSSLQLNTILVSPADPMELKPTEQTDYLSAAIWNIRS